MGAFIAVFANRMKAEKGDYIIKHYDNSFEVLTETEFKRRYV